MKFTPTTIKKNDDGFFLIDSTTGMLSTKMMAVSPRHPIMYYAVQHLLLDMLMEESSSSFLSSVGTATIIHNNTTNSKNHSNAITGSFILSRAFRTFQEGQEEGDNGNLSPGVFHGVMNRTIRVVAGGGLNINNNNNSSNENENEKNNNNLVMPIFSSEQEKETEFQKMGVMVLVEEDNSSDDNDEVPSCLDGLYHRTGVSVSF